MLRDETAAWRCVAEYASPARYPAPLAIPRRYGWDLAAGQQARIHPVSQPGSEYWSGWRVPCPAASAGCRPASSTVPGCTGHHVRVAGLSGRQNYYEAASALGCVIRYHRTVEQSD